MAVNAESPTGRFSRGVQILASPRWMLAFFFFAACSALVSIYWPRWITPVWLLPLGMFAISLLAAVATNPRLRRDPALLGLHLGLLALVILVALARLTYLDGVVTLTQGSRFEGRLQLDRRGPLHPGGIEHLRFENLGVLEDYSRSERWRSTANRVRWWDRDGRPHDEQIGDDTPLRLEGYRIYTTFNRGYSPVFRWEPDAGPPEIGTVQLRPGRDVEMASDWMLPGGPSVGVVLHPREAVTLARGERRSNLGAASLAHDLVVYVRDRRHVLQRGESLRLPEGRLTYLRLETWMGYRVVFDMAMYWMASAAAVAVVCMVWFYSRLLRSASGSGNKEGKLACA